MEINKVGEKVSIGGAFGLLESVKATSDIYSPVEGVIAEVNENPNLMKLINSDAEGEGWIIKVNNVSRFKLK